MTVKTDPYTFANGTTADGLEVNARFNPLYTLQNGGIDYTNMDTSQPLKLRTGVKLFFDDDGDEDTYFYEKSEDVIAAVCGGTEALRFTSTYFVIPATSKLYLDGGDDTFFYESSANVVKLYTGGTLRTSWQSTGFVIENGDFLIPATSKLYLDGGGDTFFYESAANTVKMYNGGTLRMTWQSNGVVLEAGDLFMLATSKIYYDGGGDTYTYESSGNVLDTYVGGTKISSLTATTGTFYTNTTITSSLVTVPALVSNGTVDLNGNMLIIGTTSDYTNLREGAVDANNSSVIFSTRSVGTSQDIFRCRAYSVEPVTDNTVTCGSGSYRWSTVYAATGTINTSDENLKDEISESKLGLNFLKELKPIQYKWKNSKDNKLSLGFSAQEIEKTIGHSYSIIDKDKDSGVYGLRYNEFISPIVMAIKELNSRIEKIEART